MAAMTQPPRLAPLLPFLAPGAILGHLLKTESFLLSSLSFYCFPFLFFSSLCFLVPLLYLVIVPCCFTCVPFLFLSDAFDDFVFPYPFVDVGPCALVLPC